jgi:F-type H+-transporting ATPase subunit delta
MKPNRHIRRASRQVFRLCLVNGLLDAGRVRRAAHYLAHARRRGGLALLADFHRLVRLDHERHTARIESAAPLSAAARDGIQAGLEYRYGLGLHASFEQNPALIGGMRITVGSDVYDGSLRARLATLASRL